MLFCFTKIPLDLFQYLSVQNGILQSVWHGCNLKMLLMTWGISQKLALKTSLLESFWLHFILVTGSASVGTVHWLVINTFAPLRSGSTTVEPTLTLTATKCWSNRAVGVNSVKWLSSGVEYSQPQLQQQRSAPLYWKLWRSRSPSSSYRIFFTQLFPVHFSAAAVHSKMHYCVLYHNQTTSPHHRLDKHGTLMWLSVGGGRFQSRRWELGPQLL